MAKKTEAQRKAELRARNKAGFKSVSGWASEKQAKTMQAKLKTNDEIDALIEAAKVEKESE